MKLKDKAANIDLLADLTNSPKPTQWEIDSFASGSTQQPRSGVEAITASISMRQRNQDLEQQLKEYEDMPFVEMLDPKSIRPSRFQNRDARSFATKEFEKLKAEISAIGKNVQPIKVRVVGHEGGSPAYEIVYGRRRSRACEEIGIKVAAIVVHNMDDQTAFVEADKENQQQQNLSPWEQGVKYRAAVDSGLFPSQRRLAAVLGFAQGTVSKAIAIANLPDVVINAFESPLEIQFRWGSALEEAILKCPEKLACVAKEVAKLQPRLPASQVFQRLIGRGSEANAQIDLKVADRSVGCWVKDRRGNLTFKIKAGVLGHKKEEKLLAYIKTLMT